jgi:PKD repeat protein
MKFHSPFLSIVAIFFLLPLASYTQADVPVHPSVIRTGTFLGITQPVRDMQTLSEADKRAMEERARQRVLNEELEKRRYPYAASALPKGPDPAWQRTMGETDNSMAAFLNFAGQSSPYYPPDCDGTAGPYHYFQMVNCTFSIYSKSGTLLTGPTNINLLFNGVTGSNYNDGDPIVLYDDKADRWLATEFSVSGTNNYMLMAVSTTNDPTGTWYAYSFDVADMPDYPKFGVWRDGYYMGDNNSGNNDIYVFQRSQMLTGGAAQMVGFTNAWRPTTVDGFMCVPPVDNDGPWAPEGSPGIFITINDDAIGGGSDQLWIYELAVNWTTPASSTFTRTQQLNVNAFDSNFGTNWDNIPQSGTTQKLDAIPMVIMNVPQYRNFGSYQTIVCCHTVDVDNTNHAGVRWYELRKTTGSWSVRQQGTYAPDANCRWMGSIMLNGYNEIALGYSISSSALYPGIRYTGQSATAYAAGAGTLDITEGIIQTGANYQTTYNRWGDYSQMAVDPFDDKTFWFTSEYLGSGSTRQTRVASIQLGNPVVTANFSADNTTPQVGTTVSLSDASTGGATSWNWSFSPGTVTFVNSTSATSQNPKVQFNANGAYTITLQATNAYGWDTLIRTNLVHVGTTGLWTGASSTDWGSYLNWHNGLVPPSAQSITIPSSATYWPVYTGNLTIGSQCGKIILNGSSFLDVTGNLTINPGYSLTLAESGTMRVGGDWSNSGIFSPGTGTLEFTGTSNSSIITGLNPAGYITNYTRSTFPAGMTALLSPSAGPSGNNAISTVSLGFTFNYMGTAYTTGRLSTNGWLSLNLTGAATTVDNTTLFSTSVPNATLAPWFDDLSDDGTSSVNYKTEGTAPNRVFTAEWYRVRSYSTGNYVRISFQAKLYETTNVIEFHYGTVESGTHNSSESASIGIEDATGGSGHFMEGTTGSTTTGISTLSSATNWPTTNFRFTPPSGTPSFYNLTISKTSPAQLLNTGTVVVNGTMKVNP